MKQLKIFYVFSAIILLSGMMCACGEIIYGDEDENENGSSSSGGNNNLKTSQIEMKIKPMDDRIAFDFIANGKVTIEWGDGIINEFTSNGTKSRYTHTYPNQNSYIIKVTTEVMTLFEYPRTISVGTNSYYVNADIYELRFGTCPHLQKISCNASNGYSHPDQQLTILDVSKCTALTMLECAGNQLTSLDVSKCTALTMLNCTGNQLTSLDVSKCTALTMLGCDGNQLSASALNALFNSLPTRKQENSGFIDCRSNPGSATCDKTIAEKKGWGLLLMR